MALTTQCTSLHGGVLDRRAVRSTNMSSSEQLRAQVVRRSDVIGMGPRFTTSD